MLSGAHHAVQDILAQDVSVAKLQDHVLVGRKHQRAQELQAPLWEVNVQHWIPRVKL